MVVPNQEPQKPARPRKPTNPKQPLKLRKSCGRSLPVRVPASAAPLSIINSDAAGIDVHSNMHIVCVPADRDPNPVRQFAANTADLQTLLADLHQMLRQHVVIPVWLGVGLRSVCPISAD